MNFNEYQEKANTTAVYPDKDNNIAYPVLGLCGEAGSVSEVVKKIVRDKQSIATTKDKALIEKKLGDTLWYISALCNEVGISLDDVANKNLEMLKSRQQRGTLQGSGNDR